MEIAKLIITGAMAHVKFRDLIPAGLVGGYITVEYFDPLWDGLTKTVVFKRIEKKDKITNATKDVITNATTIEIPPELIATPEMILQVGFYGTNAERVQVIPTLWADLGMIQPAADPSGDTTTDPTLPVYAQLAQRVGTLEDKVENLKPGGSTGGGGVDFETDDTLNLENGILSVNTTDDVEEHNDLPITSHAVYNEFSKAVALLRTI